MSKILAIDFGLKRTGLAITDESKTFAFGLDTIPSSRLETRIDELLEHENIDCIVIGMPLRLNTSDTHISENVRLLAGTLREKYRSLRIELYDERFTSKMAAQAIHLSGASRKQKTGKELIDKVSATILLQSWLSSQR